MSVRSYPQANFPSLWAKVEALIANGRLRATELVLQELERIEDETARWARSWRQMFVPIDERIQPIVRDILATHERLVDARKGRSGADPFVIALAEQNGWAVVTDKDEGSAAKPKIPFVCRARGLRVLSVIDLIREEGWVL